MGLGDLVDEKGGDAQGGTDNSSDSEDEYSSRGWSLNRTNQKLQDQIDDALTVVGEQSGSTELYRIVGEKLRISDGVIKDNEGEEMLDVTEGIVSLSHKEVTVTIGDLEIERDMYEVRKYIE